MRSLIFIAFLVSLMIIGMDEMAMAQDSCEDTRFLFPCMKFECNRMCVLAHGDYLTTWGKCVSPVLCRCHFSCHSAKEKNPQPSSPPSDPSSPYTSVNP
ncbi:hypothetical protein Hanom_Chr02g00121911 [Helianthus anomalus]